MEGRDGRRQGKGEGAIGLPQPPWSPGPALLRPGALTASLILPKLLPPSSSLPLPSLLLPFSSSSLLPPSYRGTPPPAPFFPHHSTFQDEQAQSTTEVVVLQTRVLPREQRDTGDSGDYEQDGVRRANPGAELAGSYSPVALKLPVAEHTEGARMVTTNKMAFSPDPTSFAGTLTPSCPQLSACVVPDGSRSPSAAIPLPFLIVRNNGKVRRNEDYKQDGGREAYT